MRGIRWGIERGQSVDQPAADIRGYTRASDVESDFAQWRIGACIGGRPVQAGDDQMIIIPKKKLAVKFTIVNLNESDASGGGERRQVLGILLCDRS